MSKIFLKLSSVALLAGCATAVAPPDVTTPPVSQNAPPIASSGYAQAGNTLFTAGETLTFTAKLLRKEGDTVTVTEAPTVIRMTDDPTVAIATVDGVEVTLNRDGTNPLLWTGTSGDITVSVNFNYASPNQQLAAFWRYVTVGTGEDMVETWATSITGFNTDPVAVAARTGTASYSGYGIMTLDHSNGRWSSSVGTANLVADFGTATISGSIDNMTSYRAASDNQNMVSGASVTINPTSIAGNTFATDLTLNPADFGLNGAPTTQVDGMFYETAATGVGGMITGTGIDADGTSTVVIQGGFAAAE